MHSINHPKDIARDLTDRERTWIEVAIKHGFGAKRIAKQFGIQHQTVRRILKGCGIQRKPTAWNKGLKGTAGRKVWSEKAKARALERKTQNLAIRLYLDELKREAHASAKPDRLWLAHPEFTKWRIRKHEERNPVVRIRKNLRFRVWKVVKRVGGTKCDHTMCLTGCTPVQLHQWIERQFTSRMSWSNYGRAWEIDHIIPCAKFDLTKPDEQRLAFHFTNLRPLWKRSNRRKHAKLIAPQQSLLLPA